MPAVRGAFRGDCDRPLASPGRLVLLSVSEGEDKPLKYPAIFSSADLVVISKCDLTEAVGFDRSLALHHLQQVAPGARVLPTSARTGAGLETLLQALLPVAASAAPPG